MSKPKRSDKEIITDLRSKIEKINDLQDEAHKNILKVEITREDPSYTNTFPIRYLKIKIHKWDIGVSYNG